MDELIYRYDYIIIDAVNFAYKKFKHKDEIPVQIGNKLAYRASICDFIHEVEEIVNKYLSSTGEVFLLFDNYFSKADLHSMFVYVDRKQLDEAYKSNRKKDNKEFYNSLNFLRYYYIIGPETYHTVRIDNLEADDLVEPILNKYNLFNDKSKKALLISNDLDWSRYLSDNVDWLPNLNENPQTRHELSNKLDFEVTYDNIVLYKVLFGDESDNIDQITTKSEKHFDEFKEMVKNNVTASDIIFMSRDEEACKKYTLLSDVQKPDIKRKFLTKEALVKINIRLVTAIPCSVSSLNSNLTTGRNVETLYKTVREAIGLDDIQKFVFGNVRRSRA